ncbi:MAG: hypothetical protein ACRD8O_02115 [Bryobacteraceae bacterium]
MIGQAKARWFAIKAMEFEQFKDFMLQSAAQHDARITVIEESVRGLAAGTRIFATQTRDAMNRLTTRRSYWRIIKSTYRILCTALPKRPGPAWRTCEKASTNSG